MVVLNLLKIYIYRILLIRKYLIKFKKKIGEDESESNLKAFKNYSKSVKSIKELENYSDEDNSILTQIKNNKIQVCILFIKIMMNIKMII